MASYIGRRKFLATLLGAAAAWPLESRAQQPKVPTIGFLGALREPIADAFVGLGSSRERRRTGKKPRVAQRPWQR
jgi:hypothetical protein